MGGWGVISRLMVVGALALGSFAPAAVRAQEAPAQQATPPAAQPAISAPAPADEAAAKLQAAAANPIASLVSIPFQYNVNFNTGPYRLAQQVLNAQPVIPSQLGGGRTWVSRIVTPLIVQPALAPNSGMQVGLGDINPQFFYVPKQGEVMLGYGPTMLLPTGTSPAVGSGKWGLGPDAVIVITQKNVVYGLLVNNLWSVAGDSSRAAVNQGLYQGFSSWTLPHGVSIGITSTSTVNWNAPGTNKWTVPIGPTFNQLVKMGDGMGQIGGAIFWNAVRPQYGSTFTVRLVLNLLSPAK
ncbi:MAG TPA: hypothetical protein VGF86_16435 [Candidatus Tumulicola sp.]|jgi:hypothetical protein